MAIGGKFGGVELALALLLINGCSNKPGRVATPDVDAEEAAGLAIKEFDKDADAQLDEAELKSCPPLLDALPAYDSNQDGLLAQAEISSGIESWSQRGIGSTPLHFTIRLNGRPLSGGHVKLVPATFLGTAIKPATGEADGTGSGSLNMATEDRPSNLPKNLPLIQPGLYKVEITHPTVKVPAKFNTATILGIEAAIAGQNPIGVTWDLTSK